MNYLVTHGYNAYLVTHGYNALTLAESARKGKIFRHLEMELPLADKKVFLKHEIKKSDKSLK